MKYASSHIFNPSRTTRDFNIHKDSRIINYATAYKEEVRKNSTVQLSKKASKQFVLELTWSKRVFWMQGSA
jgi:hypothetical protein